MKRVLVVVVASLGALGQTAMAASIKSINQKKFLVAVDLEEDETFEKDSTVCFYGEDGKKIDCGTVVKVKGTMALVKVESKKKMKKLEAGMAAKLGEGDGAAAASDEESADEPTKGKKAKKKKKKGKNDEEGESEAAEKPYKGKKSPMRVWAFYSPAISTPAVYNKVGYKAPSTATPDTLWTTDKAIKTTLVGFNLQAGIPIGVFSLNPGFRYRKFTPSLVDADYQPQRENPYVSTEEQATALGLWVDFQYFRMPVGKDGGFWLTSGLDIDSSTVTIKSTKKDDTTGASSSIAKATSKLTVASLRLGAGVDLVVAKPFGLFAGTTLMVPLSEVSKTFTGSLSDDEARGLAGTPGDDLKTQLGHKKNTYGFEISLGAMLSF